MFGMFLKGILTGLVFGVPAGAIGALTIQRTIRHGFVPGLVTGLGSSLADLIYGFAGISGITVIPGFITSYSHYIQIAGGIFIAILGILVFKKGQEEVTGNSSNGNIVFYFLSSFCAAIMNPASVLSFIAAFTMLGINGSINFAEGAGLLSGILSGTLCWWAALAGIVSLYRDRVTGRIYKVLNVILGSLMLVFGAVMVIKGAVIVPAKALK